MGQSTRNSLIVILSFFITSLLNYAFGVILSWFYNPAEYGMLGIAQSLLLLIALVVGSGFTWTVTQDIAANGLAEATRLRFRSAVLVNTLLGMLLAGGLWLAYRLGWLSLGVSFRLIVPLVGMTSVVLAMRSVVNGAARGLFQFSQVAVNLVGEVAVKVLVGLYLVRLGWGVEGVLTGFIAGAAVSLLHSLWITRGAGLWIGKGWLNFGIIRRTAPVFLGMVGTALMLNLDLLGLKFFAPPSQAEASAYSIAGYYQAAVILARTPVFIAQALTLVLFSYAAGATRLAAEGGEGYLQRVQRMWVRLLIPGCLVLIIAPGQVLSIFFPPIYQAAARSLQLAALGCLLLALVTLLTGVFQAGGIRRQPALANAAAVLAQLICLAMLVPIHGASGAAISLIVAGGVALGGLLPLVKAQLTGIPWEGWKLFVRTAFPYFGLILPLLALPSGTRPQAFINIILAGTLYLACLGLVSSKPPASHPAGESGQGVQLSRFYQLIQILMGG